jgi:hypothetical protein
MAQLLLVLHHLVVIKRLFERLSFRDKICASNRGMLSASPMLVCAIAAAFCTSISVRTCALLTVSKMRTFNLSVAVVKHTAIISSAPVTPVPVRSWIVVLVAELPVTALFDAPMERKVRLIVG